MHLIAKCKEDIFYYGEDLLIMLYICIQNHDLSFPVVVFLISSSHRFLLTDCIILIFFLSRCTMEYLGRKVIKRKSDILLTSLDPKDLLDFIIQEDMLTEGERQIMMNEVTRQGRVRKTLEYLKRKKGGFDLLIRMLNHGRMEWLSMPLLKERDQIIAAGGNIFSYVFSTS